ncbi:MAG: TRAP transporter small permease [Planctomycetota bacterium]|jgi:TRAP-type C4-dicarboxylate transport system permease small subunit
MQRLVKALLRFDGWIARLEVAVVTVDLLLMASLFAVYVVRRNAGQGSVAAFQVVAQHLVLWVAMVGASLCARERKHIAIELVDKLLGKRGKAVVHGLTLLSTAVVCAGLSFIAWKYVMFERTEYLASPNPQPLFQLLGVSVARWISLLVMPVGFALMTERFTLQLLELIVIGPPPGDEEELREEIKAVERRLSSGEDAFGSVRGPGPGQPAPEPAS